MYIYILKSENFKWKLTYISFTNFLNEESYKGFKPSASCLLFILVTAYKNG